MKPIHALTSPDIADQLPIRVGHEIVVIRSLYRSISIDGGKYIGGEKAFFSVLQLGFESLETLNFLNHIYSPHLSHLPSLPRT